MLGWAGVRGYGQRLWQGSRGADWLKVSACYHPKPDVAQEASERMQVKGHSNWQAFLDAPTSAVVLAVPNQWHYQMAADCLEAGKHVLVEKPLTNTVKEGERLITLAARKNRLLAVGHNYRKNNYVRKMKEWIDAGRIGPIVMAEFNMSHGGAMTFTENQWRFHTKNCPGGPLNMLGSHLIDAANYFFGVPESVSGMAQRLHAPTTAEDTASVQIRYPHGVLATIHCLYNSVSTEFIHIYGTRGALRFQRWPECRLVYQPMDQNYAAAPYEPIAINENDSASETLHECVMACSGQGTVEVGGPQALEVVKVIEQVLAAGKKHA